MKVARMSVCKARPASGSAEFTGWSLESQRPETGVNFETFGLSERFVKEGNGNDRKSLFGQKRNYFEISCLSRCLARRC